MINSKKGGMFDIFLAIILSFISVVCLVIFMFAQQNIETKLLEQAPNIQPVLGQSGNATLIIQNTIGRVGIAYQQFKWITVMFLFGYFLSVLISSFLVRTHPVFFVVHILISIVAILIAIYLSNSYETIYQTGILASTWFSFTGANFIFLYLPYWVTIISFISGILMYSNIESGGNY